MINGASRAAEAPAPEGRDRELKFELPDGRPDAVRRWLDAICRRDPRFPSAIVWTIYYDTPDLASLGEKINSDYLKRKIRVRWYSEVGGEPKGPVFVEAKLRVGNRRVKARAQAPWPAEEVAAWDLDDPRLRDLPRLLGAEGVLVDGLWQPLMLIRYRRERFIEPAGQARISLDADIAVARVNPRLMAPADDRALPGGVLEVKGAGDELPLALRPLLALGARKRSFSKYLAVYARAARRVL
jgi:hypothetical protein